MDDDEKYLRWQIRKYSDKIDALPSDFEVWIKSMELAAIATKLGTVLDVSNLSDGFYPMIRSSVAMELETLEEKCGSFIARLKLKQELENL